MDKTDTKKYRFLLGGYDLEMVAIKQLLEANDCLYEDRNLAWGARLSAYIGLLNNHETFVGIELVEDINPPEHYIAIDHHNLNSDKPSSIEQVAKLLGVSLNRYQQLVAANDSGYIPAMLQAGAKEDEILQIRQADRRAQGVSEDDEDLAISSIEKKLNRYGELLVIESLTPKFSAITDRLYPFEKLLIAFDNHFVYYGKGTAQLIEKYRPLIEDKKAYYGGLDKGFFGLDKKSFTTEEANRLKLEVIQQMSGK